MAGVELSLGNEVTVSFEAVGTFDWPFHSYGRATETSRTPAVTKSWCYMENWPLGYENLEHYQAAYRQLFGRYPSFKTLLDGAKIEADALVLRPQRGPTHHRDQRASEGYKRVGIPGGRL
jgi:hypothetical protein